MEDVFKKTILNSKKPNYKTSGEGSDLNRNWKKDRVGMSKKILKSANDESFMVKESERIKVEPGLDENEIKTETYEDEELLSDDFDFLSANCTDHIADLSLPLGSSMAIRSIKLEETDSMQNAFSLQKSKKNVVPEYLSEMATTEIDQLSLAEDKPQSSTETNSALQADSIFTCNVSSYNANNFSVLENHILTHGKEKLASDKVKCVKTMAQTRLKGPNINDIAKKCFSCDVCSYKTMRISHFNRHIFIHTGEKPFSCEFCSYKTNRMHQLKSHHSIHIAEKPFSCQYCTYTAKNKQTLKRHLLIHTGKRQFSCEFCSHTTYRASSLKQHLLVHTGEKPFSCEICSFKTAHIGNLKQHILTHTGEKPFPCEFCSYKTNQSSILKQHLLSHSREKPFSCEICSYKAKRKEHLKDHILSHIGETHLSCEFCSYKTNRKQHLKSHILTHTGDKHFSCQFCPFTTNYKQSLKRHDLTH